MEERLRVLDSIEPLAYASYPATWPVGKHCFMLQVTSCKHFRKEGIREGGYIGIDPELEFKEGEPCAFVKITNGKPKFKLSRKLLEGYKYIGRLSVVLSFPNAEV